MVSDLPGSALHSVPLPPSSLASLLVPEENLTLSSRFLWILPDRPPVEHAQNIREYPGATASRPFGEQLLGNSVGLQRLFRL